jgi:SAM-dependent methyltransferase
MLREQRGTGASDDGMNAEKTMLTASSANVVPDIPQPDSLATCAACGSQRSRGIGMMFDQRSRGSRIWRRCLNCRSFFDAGKYDRKEEVVHTQGRAWGKPNSGKQLNQFKTRMFQNVLHLLRKHSPPPATLLDVGCSYGGFLIEARKAGYQVSGFDIVPEAVKYVQSLHIPAELSFSIRDATLTNDRQLDLVTCLDCNCYWPDQAAQLRDIFTTLRPGGYLAMRVVDKSWMFSVGLAFGKIAPALSCSVLRASINDHRFSMPVKSLLRVIRSIGFDLVYASPQGAVHSDKTKTVVKLSFALGAALWKATGIFMAPGALVLAKKPVR